MQSSAPSSPAAPPSAHRDLTGSALAVLAGSGAALAGSVLSRLVMARVLAPADLGLLLLAVGIVTAAGGVASLGTNPAAAVRMAALRARGDEEGAAAAARGAVVAALLAGGVAAIALLAGAPRGLAALFVQGPASVRFAAVLAALSPVVLALPLGLAALGISRGHGRSAPRALLRDGGGGVLRAAAVAGAAAAGGGVMLLATGYALAVLVAEVLLLAFVLGRGWLRRRAGPLLDGGLLRSLPSFAALEVVGQAHGWIDVLLIGAVAAPAEVGLYAFARGLTRALTLVASAVHHGVLPALGGARTERVLAVHRRGWRLALAFLWPAVACGVLAPELPLRFLAGEPYVAAAPALRLLSFALLFEALGAAQEQLLVARRGAARAVTLRLVSVAVTAALLPPFAVDGGATGAAFALLVGHASRAGLALFLARRLLGLRVRDEVPVALVPALALAGLAGGAAATWPGLATTAGILVAAAAGAAILFPWGERWRRRLAIGEVYAGEDGPVPAPTEPPETRRRE